MVFGSIMSTLGTSHTHFVVSEQYAHYPCGQFTPKSALDDSGDGGKLRMGTSVRKKETVYSEPQLLRG